MAKRSKKNRGQPKAISTHAVAKPLPIDGPTLLRALVIAMAGLCVYAPVLHGGWVWDDIELVTHNMNLRSVAGLGKIWFATPSTDYWPLTWTLLWIEWQLWGNEPLGYHLCNLALHIASGFVLWRVLDRLGLRWGWVGGLLFVVHPLAVESVAWVSEIKNALSLPFFLLAFDAWLDAEEDKPSGYGRSLLYYLAAMLAKTSTVMLPVVLLLYCWWKRGRVTVQEIKRLIPYFAIALVLGLITIYFQTRGQDPAKIEMAGIGTRLVIAASALFFYLGKFIYPVGLLPIYPVPSFDPPSLLQMLALPGLALLLGGAWVARKSWGRYLLFGFGFFLLNLLPVLGLVKMEYMLISWVADHLAYIAVIGLIGLVVAGLEAGSARMPGSLRPFGLGVVAGWLILLGWVAHQDAAHFVDEKTLWTYTLEQSPQNWTAHNNLGNALLHSGRVAEAMAQYEAALTFNPHYAEAHNNLGATLLQTGHLAEAIDQLEQALKINPDYTNAHSGLGVAFMRAGRLPEAIDQYQQALKINPNFAMAHHNLADALVRTGRVPEAIAQYELALKLNPEFPEAHNNLGDALTQTGRLSEAIDQYELALKFRPNYPPARNGLARAEALQAAAPGRN